MPLWGGTMNAGKGFDCDCEHKHEHEFKSAIRNFLGCVPMTYQPIANYGISGGPRTVARVGMNGSIVICTA